MNRLLIIGNGFDLAHNLKTKYSDFILFFLQKVFKEEESINSLLEIRVPNHLMREHLPIESKPLEDWSILDFSNYIEYSKKKDSRTRIKVTHIGALTQKLISATKNHNWVDVENEYYKLLCSYASIKEIDKVMKLNDELLKIQKLLQEYLIIESQKVYSHSYNKEVLLDILSDEFEYQFLRNHFNPSSTSEHKLSQTLQNLLILNFNYTYTFKILYSNEIKHRNSNTEIINLHGEAKSIKNPVIFGYGDEEDTNFQLLQNYDECLRYIKTYWYMRTHNYQNTLSFVESDNFEVLIAGHSCGLSDKTLLSEIFNHENCKRIRILTYNKKEEENFNLENSNYIEMSYQIGRLFSNKASLRKKLAPFNKNDLLQVMKK